MPMRPRNTGSFDHHYFKAIDTEAKAYWLGFIMADGCVRDTVLRGAMELSIHLAGKDQSHLERFKEAVGAVTKVHTEKSGSVRVGLRSDHLCSDLISHGCTARKSLTLQFPNVPQPLERHLVRGYFDGDGSVCVSGGRLFVSFVGTPMFLGGVCRVLEVSNRPVSRPGCHNLTLGGKQVVRRLHGVFYADATVWLDRKRQVWESGLVEPALLAGNCLRCKVGYSITVGCGRANKRYCSERCRRSTHNDRRRQLKQRCE